MNKYLLTLLFVFMMSFSTNAQTDMLLTVNGVTRSATLVQNEATSKLISILEKGPVTITMSDNGGFEKVGDLPQSLPTSDVRQTAQAGDIMLYVGNVLCVFYGSNTWAYTKIGKLDNMTSSEIKEFLSGNSVEVVLSLGKGASLPEIKASEATNSKVYDLKGHLISNRPLQPGLYIIDGTKTLIR